MIDDGCTVEGYQSDITRTFVLGKASDKMNTSLRHRASRASGGAGCSSSGGECGCIDAAARKVITDAGYGPDYKYFSHRLGHGMGMDGHEWPYLVRGNTTKLQANMTTSNEPGIYIRGEFGVRHRRRYAHHRERRGVVHAEAAIAGRSVRKGALSCEL